MCVFFSIFIFIPFHECYSLGVFSPGNLPGTFLFGAVKAILFCGAGTTIRPGSSGECTPTLSDIFLPKEPGPTVVPGLKFLEHF